MAYECYEKLWRSGYFKQLSGENRQYDIKINHVKVEVNETHKKIKC